MFGKHKLSYKSDRHKYLKTKTQFLLYRKDHEIKVKVKEGQKYYGVSIPNEEFVYGVPNRYLDY